MNEKPIKISFIENYFGNSWRGISIKYVEQEKLNGTGGAIALCEEHVKDKALVLMGDDIYNKEDLEKLCNYNNAILVLDEGEAGFVKKAQVIEKDGLLLGLNEGQSQTGIKSSLINTGAYVISREYFKYPLVNVSETEFGLPNTLAQVAKDIPVNVVKANWWIQITTPDCVERAKKLLLP